MAQPTTVGRRAGRTRTAAVFAVALGVVAAAGCSGSDDGDVVLAPTTAPAAATSAVVDPGASSADGTLRIGALVPLTGTQSALGPVLEAAARAAVEDLNDAGGVLGRPVDLVVGDSADASSDTAGAEVDRLAAANVDAIVGPPSSGVSRLISDKVLRSGAVLVSAANPPAEVPAPIPYLQTAPGTALLGKAVADQVVERSADATAGPVVVLFREDDFGERLSEAVAGPLRDSQVATMLQGYNPEAEIWETDVTTMLAVEPSQVVIVGYAETATIVSSMISQGATPAQVPTWIATDRLEDPVFARVREPAALDGLSGLRSDDVVPASLSQRLGAGASDDLTFAAQTYDAVMLVALAATRSGEDASDTLVGAARQVTEKGAPQCASVSECLAAAQQGATDFVGAGGAYHLGEDGRPTVAGFSVVTFGASGTIDAAATVPVTAELD